MMPRRLPWRTACVTFEAQELFPIVSAALTRLAKLDPKPVPQPPAPKKPYVLSLVLQRKNKRGR
jgi:hypothetical protein